MRADDTVLVAWSRTTTDMRRLASRANAMAPSMITRASASEICAGVNGAGVGAWAKLAPPIVNSSVRLAIARAREKAEKMLGAKFNIRAFHDAVLELGSVPLPVVTARIDRFIAEDGKGPYPDME